MTNLVESINGLSAQWVEAMWTAVWQSTVLATGILILILCLKRTPASLRFWLWMLVPLRLLVMPMVTLYLPLLPAAIPDTPPAVTVTAIGYQSLEAAPLIENMPGEYFPDQPAGLEAASTTAATSTLADTPETNPAPSLWAYLMTAWVCAALLTAVRMSIGYWKTKQIVLRATEVTDGDLFDLAQKAAQMLGLRNAPSVLLTEAKVSPFVLGALRPVVVLPVSFVETVDRGQLLAVLAHEAAHLRRNDFIVGWVIAACEVMYFFHPVIHLVKRKLILEQEKACDDWVLVVSQAKPSHYAQAILTAAGSVCSVETHLKPATVVAESFTLLRQRLVSIAATVNPKAGLSTRACVLLIALGALCVPGIALTARKAESEAPALMTEASVWPSLQLVDQTSGVLPITASELTESLETAALDTEPFRILHFPEDSGLGTLSILTHRGTQTYRLGRESGDLELYDQWTFLAEARGAVRVPIGASLRLKIYDVGMRYLEDLSSLAPDDLHTIAFEVLRSPSDEFLFNSAQVLPYIQRFTGLKALEMVNVEATGRGLRFIKDLHDLERLEIRADTSFDDEGLVHLRNMTSLEVLNLYVPVSDEGLRHLSALTSLRELSIKYQNIRGPGLAHLANIPSLEFLQIRGDGIGNQSGGPTNFALQYLEGVTSLRSLLLYVPENITDAAISHLTKLTNLEELKFMKGWGGEPIRITDMGMPLLGSMTQLRSLDLRKTRVTDRGLAHLTGLTNLEDLRLPVSKRTRAGTHTITDATLAHLAQLPNLKRIYASSGSFTDKGLWHLSGLSNLENLTLITSERISEAGVAYLARLKNLKHLYLGFGGMTNEMVATLATITSLEHLSIPRGRVSVSGINQLNALTRLKYLNTHSFVRDDSILDLSNLTNLESLTMSIKESGDRYAEYGLRDADLAWLADHRRLQWVQVGTGEDFSDKGMAHLAGLTRLERLSIGGGLVTDRGLSHLAGLTAINSLNVTGDFSDEGLDHLDSLQGLRYLWIKSERGLSPEAEQRIGQMLPNLYTLNVARRLGAGN